MNAIGEIGNFIITYQEPLQAVAITALVVGGMICIGKAIASAAKKQKLLEEINENVAELNANVKRLHDKRREVICIEEKLPQEQRIPVPATVIRQDMASPAEAVFKEQKQKQEPAPSVAPAVKYFSRDCAVAKDGRQYTYEELDAQIRD